MRVTLVLSCMLAAAVAAGDTPDDAKVWEQLRPAMLAFQAGGSRDDFLATCRALHQAHSGSRYEIELSTLVTAMDVDARKSAPALPATPTADEAARYWIYQLRDVAGHQISDPGEPMLFGAAFGNSPNAADQLVALGSAAIPRLVDALTDDTPTRTIAWQRSFYPVYFVLRRRDVALKVLERITGARFYEEGATFVHFYMDKPERQEAVLRDVEAWWRHSRGATQTQMIENQLALTSANPTLGTFDRVEMLRLLGEIEGPEAVVPELQRMYAVDESGLNSPIEDALAELDPQTPVRAAIARFWADRSRDGDYHTLYKYGDARVYAEIARRFVRTDTLDPGSWNLGQQVHAAAEHGQGWAIPILAQALLHAKMTGARYIGGSTQSVSDADDAIEELARLTGVDFGYRGDAPEADRLAAIAKARQWWEHGGEAAMRPKIAAPHAVPVADLLRTDDELAATAHAIDDPRTRKAALAQLGGARSFVVQRALVRALAGSRDESERRAILAALQPALWELPAITDVLARPGDPTTRVAAARRMIDVLRASPTSVRVELRDVALARARAVAADVHTPTDVRQAAARVVASWSAFGERSLSPD
jgi:hypothetical protein